MSGASSPAMEPAEHLLALKVMRLTRPTLISPNIVTSENKDIPQNLLNDALKIDPTAVADAETLAAGQFMLLPQSFGNIYLGETFSSYVCVYNCTKHPIDTVSVKADLQSNSTRITLPMHVNRPPVVTLNPNDTLDDVIHHEVKEIGTHILVCEVNYVTPAGLKKNFRKFFKFQVVKPLDVKTKFYNAETDEVFLEALIQNITAGPICLEKVELESSDNYTATSLNTLPNGESVFNSRNMLQPQNSCQFLYCVKPVASIASDPKALKLANSIGKLDIVWRSNLGERGRLQTSQLQRGSIEYGDLRLSVIEASSTVRLGDPFQFTCRITNTSERSMELMLILKTKTSLKSTYTGNTEFVMGTIESGKCRDIQLTVCPVKLGLVTVTDLQITDLFVKRTYEFHDFVHVFVVDEDYKEDEEFEMNKYVKYSVMAQA